MRSAPGCGGIALPVSVRPERGHGGRAFGIKEAFSISRVKLEQTLPTWLVGQIPSPSNHY
jgi:hypothetical protein